MSGIKDGFTVVQHKDLAIKGGGRRPNGMQACLCPLVVFPDTLSAHIQEGLW